MNDIICPNCKKVFKVDEAGFADILKQVRDHKFEEELKGRLQLAEKEKENALLLSEEKLKRTFQELLAKKDLEISGLKAKSEQDLTAQIARKDAELCRVVVPPVAAYTAPPLGTVVPPLLTSRIPGAPDDSIEHARSIS